MQLGKVYLVGAGPGAADLLTIRAARIISQAQIVFYDGLVSDEVLELCPADCEIVPVDKRHDLPSQCRQETIHSMLEEAVQRYTTVVRLKGGDPGIFGRGGEEVEFLASRRIPWEVIPGISAGVCGLSSLGLPITHRKLASSVTLLTGSRLFSGDLDGIPWPLLVSPSQTLLFYMTLRHLLEISHQLVRHGMNPETYALCVSRLSYLDQKVVAAPLAQIGDAVSAAGLKTPALLVVGDVVDFWRKLPQLAYEMEQQL
ncbi:uroporphyrinogen-III C-methyltransferase [bacterium]|nr:MAG: uroporphyrinogen-III C-methyltransferase [bacterium]